MTQERKTRLLRATFTLKDAFPLGHFVFSLPQKNVIIKTPRYQENSQFAGASLFCWQPHLVDAEILVGFESRWMANRDGG
jgi:hypothetical protein